MGAEFDEGPGIALDEFAQCMADGFLAGVSGGQTVGIGHDIAGWMWSVKPHVPGELCGNIALLIGDDIDSGAPGVGLIYRVVGDKPVVHAAGIEDGSAA